MKDVGLSEQRVHEDDLNAIVVEMELICMSYFKLKGVNPSTVEHDNTIEIVRIA